MCVCVFFFFFFWGGVVFWFVISEIRGLVFWSQCPFKFALKFKVPFKSFFWGEGGGCRGFQVCVCVCGWVCVCVLWLILVDVEAGWLRLKASGSSAEFRWWLWGFRAWSLHGTCGDGSRGFILVDCLASGSVTWGFASGCLAQWQVRPQIAGYSSSRDPCRGPFWARGSNCCFLCGIQRSGFGVAGLMFERRAVGFIYASGLGSF